LPFVKLKTIISLLLLLTYSVGFAHNLVPHCADFDTEAHDNEHHHEHHSDAEEHGNEHDHVSHNNHLDENVFDYLVCLIHETETPDSDCSAEHCFVLNNPTTFKKINKAQVAIVLFAIFQPIVHNETIVHYSTGIEINYLSPPLEKSPHRGPPSFSC